MILTKLFKSCQNKTEINQKFNIFFRQSRLSRYSRREIVIPKLQGQESLLYGLTESFK